MIARIPLVMLVVLVSAMTFARCGKAIDENSEEAITLREHTTYEIQCLKEPFRPGPVPWPSPTPDVDLAPTLPRVKTPIEVARCDGLDGEPQFFQNEMPGLSAIVDCNDRLVRFRTRDFRTGSQDWQVYDKVGMAADGAIDAKVMYVTRLVEDAAGQQNCWIRVLGHVRGRVDCPAGDPLGARIQMSVTWTFDETPAEIMEPAYPGMADLRNGPHCQLRPGNCVFTNAVAMTCNGRG